MGKSKRVCVGVLKMEERDRGKVRDRESVRGRESVREREERLREREERAERLERKYGEKPFGKKL